MMEPTANALHAGCLGNVNADVDLPRPLGPLRAALAGRQRDRARRAAAIAALAEAAPPRERTFDGLTFTEVVAVDAHRGRASPQNVIPDRVDLPRQPALRPGHARPPRPRRACTRSCDGPGRELVVDLQRAVGARCTSATRSCSA